MAKNNRNCYIVISIIFLIFLYLCFKIYVYNSEKNEEILSNSIQFHTIDEIKTVFEQAAIPYKMKKNGDTTYTVTVNSKYMATALITLHDRILNEKEELLLPQNKRVLADEIVFDCNTIDIMINNFRNKLSYYGSLEGNLYESTIVGELQVLEYYFSKSIKDMEGVSNANFVVLYDDFKYVIFIETSEKDSYDTLENIRGFLINNTESIVIDNERIYENEIIFEGKFHL